MSLSPGARLGPYEVLSLLGAGGMGEVYRARDTRLGREVAVKVLPASVSADTDRLRRFELEARAASLLDHPHIVAIHDVGVHDGTSAAPRAPSLRKAHMPLLTPTETTGSSATHPTEPSPDTHWPEESRSRSRCDFPRGRHRYALVAMGAPC
jgi:serine/threonine protein kinase